MQPISLLLDGIKVIKEGSVLFNDLNLAVKKSEIHTVIPSSIKDYLNFQHLLISESEVVSGSIKLFGKDINPHDILRESSQVQYLLNEKMLFSHFTVIENIYFFKWPAVPNRRMGKYYQQYREVARDFGINIKPEILVSKLSKEEALIVELIRAYISDAPLVFMFDSLSSMNSEFVYKAQNIMRRMKGKGRSILYVVSKLESAYGISDRISLLSDGKIKKTYDAQDVFSNPQELIYLLSGGEKIADGEKIVDTERTVSDDSNKLLQTIIRHHAMLDSGYTLNDNLGFLAINISKIMSADNCIIYLYDTRYKTIIDSTANKGTDLAKYKLKIDVIKRLVHELKGITVYNNMDESFSSMFMSPNDNIQTIFCMPITSNAPIIAIVQVSFGKIHFCGDLEKAYMEAFSREIAIAIEVSQLMDNSLLLQETHHRIKNNLQMIISILYMYSTRIHDMPQINSKEMLQETIFRIKSIAIIHDLLAQDKFSGGIISLKEIIEKVSKFYEANDIVIKINLSDINVPYNKATSISMIVNELISNCVKHAFSPNSKKLNTIEIEGRGDNDWIHIIVSDNGTGVSDDFDIDKINSIGLSIVKSVISSVHGSLIVKNKKSGGLSISIAIPSSSLYT